VASACVNPLGGHLAASIFAVSDHYMWCGGRTLVFQDAELKFVFGRRYGLIGRNGIGKSTLLQAIAHYDIDSFPTHLRVAHVEQEVG